MARIVALSPSIAVAQKELVRQGMRLDKKAVRRIAEQLGTQMLALRQRELLAWRAGALPAGKDFRGKRVVVQFDGGRIRMRENKPRRKQRRKGEREKFDVSGGERLIQFASHRAHLGTGKGQLKITVGQGDG